MLQWRNWHTRQIYTLFSLGSTPGWSTIFEINSGGDFVNNISAVAIGMLIAAHREGDEEKFRAYVELIAETYEQQGNDHAANIIRSYYTGDYGEQGKAVLDETTEQTTYYETGWYEPDVLGSGGSYYGVTKATSEEEALQRLLKHSADYAQRITLYKKDGKIVKQEISEYDQWEKKWRYTIGLDTDQGTLRELTADELPDADRLPDGEYV